MRCVSMQEEASNMCVAFDISFDIAHNAAAEKSNAQFGLLKVERARCR